MNTKKVTWVTIWVIMTMIILNVVYHLLNQKSDLTMYIGILISIAYVVLLTNLKSFKFNPFKKQNHE